MLTSLAAPAPTPAAATGLYHVAWLHPSRAALADTVRRIAAAGWRFDGASDHGVSEALYLSDPDGLGIEVYADRPQEAWERPPGGRGVRMYTLPLDLGDLLALANEDGAAEIAPGTHVGHVHLKVADVEETAGFYAEELGFEEQARLPAAAFLGAGGYHHHLGLNSWESAGGEPAPQAAPGLRRIEFALADEAAMQDLRSRLSASLDAVAEDQREFAVRDPDGQLLAFTHV